MFLYLAPYIHNYILSCDLVLECGPTLSFFEHWWFIVIFLRLPFHCIGIIQFLSTIAAQLFIHLTNLKIKHHIHVHNINLYSFHFIILYFTINTILVNYFFLSLVGDIKFTLKLVIALRAIWS